MLDTRYIDLKRFAILWRGPDGKVASLCFIEATDAEAALATFHSWSSLTTGTFEAVAS
jgi:hypothetical protein